MTRNKNLRAWLYLRMSEDKTGEELGIQRQEFACINLCEQRGWTVVGKTVENAVSAYKGDRKGFAELLELVRSRRIDVIVTWAADRLARKLTDLETLIDACEKHGVKIATVTGDMDLSTDAGRLVARILTSVARGEVERKSARQRAAFEQALRDGAPHGGGPRPFGWEQDRMTIRRDEAGYVEDAYRRFVDGASLGEIARAWDGEGLRTPKGNKWSAHSLREVLTNPRHAGLRGHRPYLYSEDGSPVIGHTGRHVRSRRYEITGKAAWPAIVDEVTWRATIRRLEARATGRPSRGRKHLLAGVARCAECGQVLKTKTNNVQRSLACPTRRHATRKAEPVEAYVMDVILERLRRDDAIDLIQRQAPEVDVRALRDEQDAIRSRLREIAQDEVLGRRTRDEVLAAREVADHRLTDIDSTLADAGRSDIVARFVATERDPGDVWDDPETTLAMQQALIESLAEVRVGSGRHGRPAKYTVGQPPPNVFIDWRR